MTPPRNTYQPGTPLDPALHAVGRPVTYYHRAMIEAGQISAVTRGPEGLLYDVRVTSGGTFKEVTLGDLNNPQPNTFTYAP